MALIIEEARVAHLVQRRATGCLAERSGSDSHQGQEINLFSTAARIVLRPIERRIQLASEDK